MKLILAEKPMLARAIAAAIDGSAVQRDGYTEKGEYTIVSAFGHLLTLKEPEDYDEERYRTDDDYARGVDDAMDDEGWDW